MIRFTVGLFTFTMLFAAGTGARIETTVPQYAVTVPWVLGIAAIAAFVFLIDYTARRLRPISIVSRNAENGIKVIESVCPDLAYKSRTRRDSAAAEAAARTVEHEGTSGIVLAVSLKWLVLAAQRIDGVIDFVPKVGDFVAVGEPQSPVRQCCARTR